MRTRPVVMLLYGCAFLSLGPVTLAAQASVAGVVREDSSGKPVVGAEVVFEAIKRRTLTDASGKYLIADLPPGARLMLVRRLGYIAAGTVVQLVAGETRTTDVTLELVPAQLNAVVVVESATRGRGGGFDGFADRRRLGLGKFIDSTMLRENENRRLEDLLRQFASLKLVPPPSCTRNAIDCRKRIAVNEAGVRDGCPLQVVLNESVVYRTESANTDWDRTFDLSSLSPSNLSGAEIYRRASEVPIEFGGLSANCGVIVLWTRR